MGDGMPARDPGNTAVEVGLTPDELGLVMAALRLLRSTLGREEADELAEVQRLLQRLEAARAAARA